MALISVALSVYPVLGQTSDEKIHAFPVSRSVTREAIRLASETSSDWAPSEGIFSAAQSQAAVENWERLRNVDVGTRLIVSRRDLPDLKGRLEGVVADTLQLRTSGDQVESLRRNDVLAVYQDHRFTTLQWVGIGALAGAGAGLVLGVISDSRCGDCELKGLGTTLGPLAGAIYGPVVGLFMGGVANRNPPRLLYRVPTALEAPVPQARSSDFAVVGRG